MAIISSLFPLLFHDRITTIILRSSLSDFSSSYGNSDASSGVIGFGNCEGGVIDIGDEGNDGGIVVVVWLKSLFLKYCPIFLLG